VWLTILSMSNAPYVPQPELTAGTSALFTLPRR
jgi:hypothetical protein